MIEEKIKEARINASMTQEKLASLLDVSTTTIQNWESGANNPSVDKVVILEKVLNLPSHYLMNEYVNGYYSDENVEEDDYLNIDKLPECLFSKNELNDINKLNFNNEEQELYVLTNIYPSKINYQLNHKERTYEEDFNIVLENNYLGIDSLPYEYIKSKGAVNVLKMADKINRINNIFKKYSDTPIINFIKKNPPRLFNFRTLDIDDLVVEMRNFKVDVIAIIKLLNIFSTNPLYLGRYNNDFKKEGGYYISDDNNKNRYINCEVNKKLNSINYHTKSGCITLSYDILFDLIDYEKRGYHEELIQEWIKSLGFFEIKMIEIDDEEYLKRKDRYLAVLKRYEDAPELYDKRPEFNIEKNGYVFITDKGKELLKWYKDVTNN